MAQPTRRPTSAMAQAMGSKGKKIDPKMLAQLMALLKAGGGAPGGASMPGGGGMSMPPQGGSAPMPPMMGR